jgi:hypothetical protein
MSNSGSFADIVVNEVGAFKEPITFDSKSYFRLVLL